MSAAEDESSREVFGLIKRVNVAPPKPKPTTGLLLLSWTNALLELRSPGWCVKI